MPCLKAERRASRDHHRNGSGPSHRIRHVTGPSEERSVDGTPAATEERVGKACCAFRTKSCRPTPEDPHREQHTAAADRERPTCASHESATRSGSSAHFSIILNSLRSCNQTIGGGSTVPGSTSVLHRSRVVTPTGEHPHRDGTVGPIRPAQRGIHRPFGYRPICAVSLFEQAAHRTRHPTMGRGPKLTGNRNCPPFDGGHSDSTVTHNRDPWRYRSARSRSASLNNQTSTPSKKTTNGKPTDRATNPPIFAPPTRAITIR